MECDGNGYCLSVRNLVCRLECVLQECPNAFVCGNREPQFILDFNQGVCNTCYSSFGNCLLNPTPSNPVLQRVEPEQAPECPVCMTQNTTEGGALGPRCAHYLCLPCLRSIYLVAPDTEPFPPVPEFPVPDVEEDYFAEPDLFLHDERIRDWRSKIGSWNIRRLRYLKQHQPYLKHCPMCRM